ncbi:hypothetical protein OROMI_011572 [Orobanche minor]
MLSRSAPTVNFDEDEDNGCDCEHWLIQLKGHPVGSRDEIIEGYVCSL